jgi:cellulose 1,4-beta-cellobiosidase
MGGSVARTLVGSGSSVTEIKRKDVQGGKVIDHSFTKLDSLTKQGNSVSDEFCIVQKNAFHEKHSLTEHADFRQLGASLNRGNVLVLSLCNDHGMNILWMHSVCPTNSNKGARTAT